MILNRVVWINFLEKVTFEQNLKEVPGQTKGLLWRKSVPSRGTSKCKSPEVGICPVYRETAGRLVWLSDEIGVRGSFVSRECGEIPQRSRV